MGYRKTTSEVKYGVISSLALAGSKIDEESVAYPPIQKSSRPIIPLLDSRLSCSLSLGRHGDTHTQLWRDEVVEIHRILTNIDLHPVHRAAELRTGVIRSDG